ncbi:hypothetical protein [Oceanimonas doudoroffii]|uniref:MSHA biogenesis protein MshK n=1 Tax=Oceanimonas doudoroffii TaxID=84158 RepID=A0A233RH03_9GAMM|nr:hypothetical protein [Oceanimonas doudoroffii]OXY82670.1 hypothetical protein B6S08_03905 [Oceanimonas doudoroffii]
MVNASALVLALLSASAGVQDPTRPLSGPAMAVVQDESQPATPRPSLQAIFTGGGVASAILDGRRYVQGDTVGGYRLVRIAGERVILEGQGERLILSLFPSFDNTDTP